MSKPVLSVLVVVYNMQREAPRTILSMLPPYQKNVASADIEILVLENGSSEPLPRHVTQSWPSNVRYLPVPDPKPSPVSALNWGMEQACAKALLFCVDGARILSDELLAGMICNLRRHPEAFVYTVGYHLGPDLQTRSIQQGYNRDVEDRLLADADWRNAPERLFSISSMAGSSVDAPFRPIAESNAFAVNRDLLQRHGGFDARFVMPGGGLCNLEIFERYVMRPDGLNIMLLREGSFHQLHGGAATGGGYEWSEMAAEYRSIFKRAYKVPQYETMFDGWPRPEANRLMARTISRLAGQASS